MADKSIKIELTETPKEKPNTADLQFGKQFTDHMFMMDYDEQNKWHDARIVPYGKISLDPSSFIFHYGQSVFEGLKAYIAENGKVHLFRPESNFARMNHSNERMCIPQIDEEFVLKALITLVDIDKSWIPDEEGT